MPTLGAGIHEFGMAKIGMAKIGMTKVGMTKTSHGWPGQTRPCRQELRKRLCAVCRFSPLTCRR